MDGNVGVRRVRRPRGLRLGVAGAVLAFLALTTVQAVGINPYLPPDELYHVGYALVVRDGRLPELTTQVPQDEVPLRVPDHSNRRIYTANHPPLYYLPVSLALRIGSPPVAFLSARLVSVAFGAAGVLLVAWLALALRRGPTFWRLAALTVAASAAALTRAPRVLALVALLGLLVALARALAVRRSLGPATTLAPWLLVAGWLLVGFLMVAWYDGSGGRTHARYLLPVIGVAAVLAAVGLDALPGARRGLVTLVVSLGLLGLTAAAWGRFTEALLGLGPFGTQVARGVADLVHQHGVPHAWLLLVPAALALLVALGLQQGGFWLLAGERQAVQEPAPAGDPTATQAGADLRG